MVLPRTPTNSARDSNRLCRPMSGGLRILWLHWLIRTVTLTLTDDACHLCPVAFADSTGGTQFWTQNTAITPVTVPAATGTPTPTYAATGVPAGINFNTTTRAISGTPTAVGSGTITVTATNSAGSATWTVAYITAAALTAPSFADNTGNAQNWTQNTAITQRSRFPRPAVIQHRHTKWLGLLLLGSRSTPRRG